MTQELKQSELVLAGLQARPRAVRLTPDALVSWTAFPGTALPTVVEARLPDLNLTAWAGEQRDLDAQLWRSGALLFRNFALQGVTDFGRFTLAVSSELVKYGERSSPRSALADGVYTSTDHPAHQEIAMHTEQSYTLHWPMKLAFYSVVSAQHGGATPLADTRKVLLRLSPRTRARFADTGVRYVRNYNAGLGLTWQQAFQTESRADVEAYCAANDISVEWRDGGRLRTSQVRPAIRRHPFTGEEVWFNHAMFFHVTSLERSVVESMLSVVALEDVPTNTFYGDGATIEPEIVAELRDAYVSEAFAFPWRDGDVLLIDNMLTAHGREPFTGPRHLACTMSDPIHCVASVARTEVRS